MRALRCPGVPRVLCARACVRVHGRAFDTCLNTAPRAWRWATPRVQVFPVFRVRLGVSNVQLYNGPVLALLACALVGMCWGILFVVFATPPYIGTIGLCVSEVAGVLIVLEIRARAHDGFNNALATLSAVARRQAPANAARHGSTTDRRGAAAAGTATPPTAADIARDRILLEVVRRAWTMMEAPGHGVSELQSTTALSAVVATGTDAGDGGGGGAPALGDERAWEHPFQSADVRRTVALVKRDVVAMLLGRSAPAAYRQATYDNTTGACLGVAKEYWPEHAAWEHAHARLGVDVAHGASGDAVRLHAACVLLLQADALVCEWATAEARFEAYVRHAVELAARDEVLREASTWSQVRVRCSRGFGSECLYAAACSRVRGCARACVVMVVHGSRGARRAVSALVQAVQRARAVGGVRVAVARAAADAARPRRDGRRHARGGGHAASRVPRQHGGACRFCCRVCGRRPLLCACDVFACACALDRSQMAGACARRGRASRARGKSRAAASAGARGARGACARLPARARVRTLA